MDRHAIFELLKTIVIPLQLIMIGFILGWTERSSFLQPINIFSIRVIRKRAFRMPVAVVIENISDKIPLRTLPPDGYVVVRRMTYGESLAREAKATKLLVAGSDSNKASDFKGQVDIQTEALALWDFANLVVEHNCQDVDGKVLNFKNVADVKKLSKTVGQEIGEIIDDFNASEETEDVKNS